MGIRNFEYVSSKIKHENQYAIANFIAMITSDSLRMSWISIVII